MVGSNSLDPESLCIVTGKYVWKLMAECVVVVDDGNVVEAVLNGCVLGLMDMRKPFVNVSKAEVQSASFLDRRGAVEAADAQSGSHPGFDVFRTDREQHLRRSDLPGGGSVGLDHDSHYERIQIDLLHSQARRSRHQPEHHRRSDKGGGRAGEGNNGELQEDGERKSTGCGLLLMED